MAQQAQEIGAQQMRIYLYGAGKAAPLAPAIVAGTRRIQSEGTPITSSCTSPKASVPTDPTLADAVLRGLLGGSGRRDRDQLSETAPRGQLG